MHLQSYEEALREIERNIAKNVKNYIMKKVTGYVIVFIESDNLIVKILNGDTGWIYITPDVVDMVFHGVTTFEISISLLKIYQSFINEKFFKKG